MNKINQDNLEELACELVGIDYDQWDEDTSELEGAVYEKYNMDWEHFALICNDLLRFTYTTFDPFDGNHIHVFGKYNKEDSEFNVITSVRHKRV